MTPPPSLHNPSLLIFSDFDTHERKNEGGVGPGGQRVNLANIPKLGKCWKVLYDLKTDEYTESNEEVTSVFTEEDKTYVRLIPCERNRPLRGRIQICFFGPKLVSWTA